MIPDSTLYNPSPDYARQLIKRIGHSQGWIAHSIGVTSRRIRYIVHGTRQIEGRIVPVSMTYPEQFALECLAESSYTNKGE